MRLFLVGFMGAGKTTIGMRLAESFGWPFVDLDGVIEARAGSSVRHIFETSGEAEFRRLEREALEEVVAADPVVVATGGGTMTAAGNLEFLERHGVTLWLNPPFSVIVTRIGALGKASRPLFRSEEEALKLFRERLPGYRRADLKVDVSAGERPEETVSRIRLLLRDLRCDT